MGFGIRTGIRRSETGCPHATGSSTALTNLELNIDVVVEKVFGPPGLG